MTTAILLASLLSVAQATPGASPSSAPGATVVQENRALPAVDRTWFALWFPDELPAQVEDHKWSLFATSLIFFGVMGGVWAPMLIVDQPLEMDWALPVITWWVIHWILMVPTMLLSWTGVGLLGGLAAVLSTHWIGTQVMMANVGRAQSRPTASTPPAGGTP